MADLIIAGNWKMNKTLDEAVALASAIREGVEALEAAQTVVCPPFTSLAAVAEAVRGSAVSVGAQNMHREPKGAFTGEVSAAMLVGLCDFVILGHSERRQHFGETDAVVGAKVKAARAAGLRPILCVGERLEQREAGQAEQVVRRQVTECLAGVGAVDGLSIAYEPVWAIGTGKAATPQVAQALMASIRSTLAALYGWEAAGAVPLLYGGSVTPDNICTFMQQRDVDGALVGGASLDAGSFVEIVRGAAGARS